MATSDNIAQFMAITNASASIAKRCIDLCGSLSSAVSRYLEVGESMLDSIPVVSSSTNNTSDVIDEEGNVVRAPIAHKVSVLYDDNTNTTSRRGGRTIRDPFRSYQEESKRTGRQWKAKKLADLFRPPVDIAYAGTFEQAKKVGQIEKKWLLVNIQSAEIFDCQKLNRDTWSDVTLKDLIRRNFIFWQKDKQTKGGLQYLQFYHPSDMPHISLIDPLTGQKLLEWNRFVNHNELIDVIRQFLKYNTFGNPPMIAHISTNIALNSSSNSKVRKRKKISPKSISQMTEDEKLQAALEASLHETKIKKPKIDDSTSNSNSKSSHFIIDEDDEIVPDSQQYVINDSDDDSGGFDLSDYRFDHDGSGLTIVSDMKKEINSEQIISNNSSNTSSSISSTSTAFLSKISDNESNAIAKDDSVTNVMTLFDLPEPDERNPDATSIQLRMPRGASLKRRFLSTSKIKDLYSYTRSKLDISNDKNFTLYTSYPKKALTDKNLTLKAAKVLQSSLFVEINSESDSDSN